MDPPNSLKERPIISAPNSPKQSLSSFLQKILPPLVPKLKSYNKDDRHFLKKLPTNLDPKLTLFNA